MRFDYDNIYLFELRSKEAFAILHILEEYLKDNDQYKNSYQYEVAKELHYYLNGEICL